jgi:hypothetical protein
MGPAVPTAKTRSMILRLPSWISSGSIIAWLPVRVLPAPPPSRAQSRFRVAVGIVFDFPWLCRLRRGIAWSLPPGIGPVTPKVPRQSLASPNLFPAEFSLPNGERFECEQRPVRVWRIQGHVAAPIDGNVPARFHRLRAGRDRALLGGEAGGRSAGIPSLSPARSP